MAANAATSFFTAGDCARLKDMLSFSMRRDEVITKLRALEPELRAAGVVRLSLFGSAARDDAGPDSDIDLLAAFDAERAVSLLDMIGLEHRLADLFGRPVDVIEEGTLRPSALENASREAVRAS